MGEVLHGSATTAEAVRHAIQHSQASLRDLAQRYGVNSKTIARWRSGTSVADRPTGPREARSSTLSIEEEAIIVAFRRHTLLPLDDFVAAYKFGRRLKRLRGLTPFEFICKAWTAVPQRVTTEPHHQTPGPNI